MTDEKLEAPYCVICLPPSSAYIASQIKAFFKTRTAALSLVITLTQTRKAYDSRINDPIPRMHIIDDFGSVFDFHIRDYSTFALLDAAEEATIDRDKNRLERARRLHAAALDKAE